MSKILDMVNISLEDNKSFSLNKFDSENISINEMFSELSSKFNVTIISYYKKDIILVITNSSRDFIIEISIFNNIIYLLNKTHISSFFIIGVINGIKELIIYDNFDKECILAINNMRIDFNNIEFYYNGISEDLYGKEIFFSKKD